MECVTAYRGGWQQYPKPSCAEKSTAGRRFSAFYATDHDMVLPPSVTVAVGRGDPVGAAGAVASAV